MSDLETSRRDAFELFLKQNNHKFDDLESLAGDASRRKFYRVRKANHTYIVIDADPGLGEKPNEYAAITHLLRNNGFSAPEIFTSDLQEGFFIVEDFGDNLLTNLLEEDSSKQEDLYQKALDILVEIQKITVDPVISYDKGTCRLQNYDINLLISEVKVFTDWYFPHITKRPTPISAKNELDAIMRGLLLPVVNSSKVVVLRDYHAANLMDLEKRSGTKSMGLLDFQDAVLGNAAYDVVSLLQDARRDVPHAFEKKMIAYFTEQAHIQDTNNFMRDYYILAAQRNMKIIGIFTRLWLRDHKDQYLPHLNRVWRYLDEDLKSPELKSLKVWFDRWLPETLRLDLAVA